jgi:hypothetical protein
MSKRELIDEIVRLNPTAKTDFLARFKEKDLNEYLEHLTWLISPSNVPSTTSPAASPAATQHAETAANLAEEQSNVAVAVADASDDETDTSGNYSSAESAEIADSNDLDDPAAESSYGEPTFEPQLTTDETSTVADQVDSEQPLPFANRRQETQEESQTYLF